MCIAPLSRRLNALFKAYKDKGDGGFETRFLASLRTRNRARLNRVAAELCLLLLRGKAAHYHRRIVV